MARNGVEVAAGAGRKRSVKCTDCAWQKGCTLKGRHPFWQRWCRLEWETSPWITWKAAAVWAVALAIAVPVYAGWIK